MNRDKYRIQGVKIGLFDQRGNMVACGRTNRNGEAIFDGIPMGQYFVKQLEGVNGLEQVSGDCVRVNLRRGNECDQVNFISVQRHGAIKVTKWGFNESVCNFERSGGTSWGDTCGSCGGQRGNCGCGGGRDCGGRGGNQGFGNTQDFIDGTSFIGEEFVD